uniref:Uncharacterized protein n=1 Tax=Sparus aurata TaxID=8175 RepID=A0A671VA03_SPAAU
MTADVAVSLVLLAGIVALSDLVYTFQLCCCTRKLRLLSEVGGIDPRLALTFEVPGSRDPRARARVPREGLRLVRAAARAAVPVICGLGLSGLQARNKLLDSRCISPEKYLVRAVAAEIAAVVYAGMTALMFSLFSRGNNKFDFFVCLAENIDKHIDIILMVMRKLIFKKIKKKYELKLNLL